MGFSLIDFFLMLSVVAIIAWFATRSQRKKRTQIEDRALLPEATIYTNRSPLLKIPQAAPGEEPYFLCFDTETVELISRDELININGESAASPPLVALSYNLLTREGHCIVTRSDLLLSEVSISPEATRLHGITEGKRQQEGHKAEEVFEAFRKVFESCQVVVAHNIASHQSFLDADFKRYRLAPLPWESKLSFCTMEHGYAYLQKTDPLYIGSSPSLRLLYSKLYYDRYDMHFSEENKSLADLLLVSACLAFLYPEGKIS